MTKISSLLTYGDVATVVEVNDSTYSSLRRVEMTRRSDRSVVYTWEQRNGETHRAAIGSSQDDAGLASFILGQLSQDKIMNSSFRCALLDAKQDVPA